MMGRTSRTMVALGASTVVVGGFLVAISAIVPILGVFVRNIIAPGPGYSYLHPQDTAPVPAAAAQIARTTRLGPTGLGAVRVGSGERELKQDAQLGDMSLDWAGRCRVGQLTELGRSSGGRVWLSRRYGVVKISAYSGIYTPEGATLGISLSKLKDIYPDLETESTADMRDKPYEMDDHFTTPVPQNRKASYRFFMSKSDRVDSMLLVSNLQDCDLAADN